MPHPNDLAGAYLDYRLDPGMAMPTAGLPFDPNGLLPNQTTAETVQVYRARRPQNNVIPMEPDGPPWTFTFLKYVPGAVTIAPLTGPILTGPMSGCLLCKYTHNGQQSIAHIGTGNTSQSPETIAVKTAWKRFIGTLPGLNSATGANAFSVVGINPASYFTAKDTEDQKLGGRFGSVPQIVGYFDGVSACAMMLAPLRPEENSRGRWMSRVAAIVPFRTLLPWSALAGFGGWQ
jgi:hypothetical protein